MGELVLALVAAWGVTYLAWLVASGLRRGGWRGFNADPRLLASFPVIAPALARLLGVEEVASGPDGDVVGRLNGVKVALRSVPGGVDVQIEGCSPLVRLDCLKTEEGARLSLPRGSARGERMETGDLVFDQHFRASGDPAAVLALLDADPRRRLLALVQDWRFGPVDLADGALRAVVKGNPGALSAMAGCVRTLLDLGAALRTPEDVPARLLGMLDTHPDLEIRTRCLLLLAEGPPGPVREQALAIAARSDDWSWRLVAAMRRGDLAAIEQAIRAGGLLRLPVRASHGSLLPQDADRDTRRGVGLLLSREHQEEARLLGARLLGEACEVGDAEAEAALIAAAETEDEELRSMVARALGKIGTARAVPALMALEKGFFQRKSAEEALAARRAVQARLVGAEPGAIRLVEADDQQGAIRVVPDEGGIRIVETRRKGVEQGG